MLAAGLGWDICIEWPHFSVSGGVSSHWLRHNDNVQLLDREATLLGTGKCPLYNYDSGMNRASGTVPPPAWCLIHDWNRHYPWWSGHQDIGMEVLLTWHIWHKVRYHPLPVKRSPFLALSVNQRPSHCHYTAPVWHCSFNCFSYTLGEPGWPIFLCTWYFSSPAQFWAALLCVETWD